MADIWIETESGAWWAEVENEEGGVIYTSPLFGTPDAAERAAQRWLREKEKLVQDESDEIF